MAWRFPRKIGEEVAGSGWGESGGVLSGPGGENFLLTESGLWIWLRETMGLCPAYRLTAESKSQTPILPKGEKLRGRGSASNSLCNFRRAILPVRLSFHL